VPPVNLDERRGQSSNQGAILQLDSVGVRGRRAIGLDAPAGRRWSVGRAKLVVIMATALLASAGMVSPPAALAQSAEVREARELFRRGKEAYAAGRFDEAYREFEAGYRLSNRPLFLFNMGYAKRRAGEAGEARALFRRFLELQPDSPHRAEVESALRELEPPAPAAPAVEAQPPAVSPPPPLLSPPPPPSVVAVAPRTPAELPPSPRRWWLWAGAGGAVLAGVLVAFLAHGRDSYTKQGSLGTLGSP
jgi:tetratricopeptide (TPR) repeat protein